MKTVHVAAGIIRKEGSDELLAVQRGYGDMQGLWEFPGGKLMRGESPEDAVRRELMEELQVKVTNLRDFYTVEYDYPDFHLSMECYYCSLADKGLIDALIELKEDRLEANGTANDAEATTTDEPATKPKRAPKRRSKKRPKPGLLDGIDTSDLSADERELVRRRAAIKKSMKGNKRANTKPELLVRQRLRAAITAPAAMLTSTSIPTAAVPQIPPYCMKRGAAIVPMVLMATCSRMVYRSFPVWA